MNLPPLPEGLKLTVEETPEELRLEWPVRGGEFRRKIMVGVMILGFAPLPILCLGPWLAAQLGVTLRIPPLSSPLLWPVIEFGLLYAWALFTWLLPMARSPGHGLLILRRDSLHLYPGGGAHPLRTRRNTLRWASLVGTGRIRLEFQQSMAVFLRNWVFSGIGYHSHMRGLPVQLPGQREAAWLEDVLRCWLTGSLIGPAP